MARLRREKSSQPTAPAWMVTYADLMSLMLTFFVLLVSFSQLQQEKIVKVLQSIQGAMGSQPDLLGPPSSSGVYPPDAAAIERLARRLQERLQTTGMDKEVRLEYDGQGGLRISLPSGVLFDSGSATLKSDPVTQRTLRDVADVLNGLPRAFFEVRGHTDNRPLVDTSVYRDNYELSFARAMAVARFVNANGGIPLEQFEIVACGPSQPAASNALPAGQAINRRVEIYVRGNLSPRELDNVRARFPENPRGDAEGRTESSVPGLGPGTEE